MVTHFALIAYIQTFGMSLHLGLVTPFWHCRVMMMFCEHGADAPKYCAICRHQGVMGKAEGITLAKDSQLNWHNEAVICIRQMARTGKPFTAEDVVAEIGAPTGSGKVIGAAFNTVARSGMIWRCGERPADRKSSHRRMLAVWRGGQVQKQVRLFDE
jgi:hypothetical protein